MKDLIYKIGGAYLYSDNSFRVDDNPIGVQFIFNGKLYLSKENIPSMKKEYLERGYYLSKYNIEVIENPHEYFFFTVDEYMDENEPGYGWGESGCPPDQRKSWKPTDIIINPTKNDIGYTRDNPRIKCNSAECQRFKNINYRKYGYNKYWNETKSGINITEYKTIAFIGDEYYYEYVGENSPFKGIRKNDGTYDPFIRDHYKDKAIGNRKSAMREHRFSKLLDI